MRVALLKGSVIRTVRSKIAQRFLPRNSRADVISIVSPCSVAGYAIADEGLTFGPTGPNIRSVTDRRSQIVDAAARLMGQRGFAPTSVDDVIKEAKLSGKSHFYHYFRSKEELGYAVLARQFERFTERGLACSASR